MWPGALLSVALWLAAARLFGEWPNISNYTRFYAGLTSHPAAASKNLFGLRKNDRVTQPPGARASWRLPAGRHT